MPKVKTGQAQEAVIRAEVVQFLRTNFPQIGAHGGQAVITEVNVDEKLVGIRLGGLCHGCGLSPVTMDAIKMRLPRAVDGIEYVAINTGELSE